MLALMAKFQQSFNYPVFTPDQPSPKLAQPGYEQWVRQKDAMVGANGGNQFRHSDQGVRTVGTQNGQIVVLELLIESQMGMEMLGWGSSCLELYKSDQGRRDGYLDENWGMSICKCILMANLQQASTSGTQTDKAPVYDSDGSVECGKEGGTVDQHLATVEETVLYFESNFILILALDRLKRSTEAAKFVRDFKSLAKEADESLAKHKTLELEIECLLTSSVDITTKTRRPQPRSNIKNDRVPSASKSSCIRIKKLKSRKKQIRASHPPKPVPNSKQRLHLLHMDLCGPMRIASINGKRYVLVIVDDYSRYTWVYNRRTKKIHGAMNVTFDELSAMAFEQSSSKPGLQDDFWTTNPNYVLESLKNMEWKLLIPVGTPMGIKDRLDLDQNGLQSMPTKYRLKPNAEDTQGGLLVWKTNRIFQMLTLRDERHLHEYFRWSSILWRKLLVVLKETRLTALSTADSRICALSVCVPSPLDSRTPLTGLWHSLQQIPISEHEEKGNMNCLVSRTVLPTGDSITKAIPVKTINYLVRRLGMRSLSPKELERLAKSQ
ncbi:retrovirus-related pol polyprotein from transposon TNT 1-94 [Tanacetum coccineum]